MRPRRIHWGWSGRRECAASTRRHGDDESGVGVRPGRVEVHVHGERAAAPNGESGEESPKFGDEFLARRKARKRARKP